MKKPLVSIVTVVFNAKADIEATIQSVLSQDYPALEYIVVDGGSTDGTLDIVQRYADRITTIVSEPDRGIYDAMNKGTRLATGEWVNFMNAGDLFASSQAVSRAMQDEVSDDVAVISGDTILRFPFGDVYQDCSTAEHFCHQSAFTRRDALLQNPYDVGVSMASDRITHGRILATCGRMEYKRFPVAVFKNYDGLSSQSHLRRFREVVRVEHMPKDFKYRLRCIYAWCLDLEARLLPAFLYNALQRTKYRLRGTLIR